MARIPLPERGQPLDVSYIYQLSNALNELSDKVSPTNNKNVTVDAPNVGKQNVEILNTKIVGKFIAISTGNSTKNAGDESSFSYSFDTAFRYPPIVTATAVNNGDTPAGKNVIVILKRITESGVEGIVKFNSSGELSVGVNLIAIGIPN